MTNKEAIEYLQPVADNTPLTGYARALNLALDALRKVDKIVSCKDCVMHGHCSAEDAFKLVRIENPFCCVGERRADR